MCAKPLHDESDKSHPYKTKTRHRRSKRYLVPFSSKAPSAMSLKLVKTKYYPLLQNCLQFQNNLTCSYFYSLYISFYLDYEEYNYKISVRNLLLFCVFQSFVLATVQGDTNNKSNLQQFQRVPKCRLGCCNFNMCKNFN